MQHREPRDAETQKLGDSDTQKSEHNNQPTFSALSVSSVLQAIVKALPKDEGQRRRKLFNLARRLKAIPETKTADLTELRPVVEEWHRRAIPFLRTKEFTESWADFVYGWERVKHPVGQGAIEAAFQRATAAPPPTRAAELYDDLPQVQLLASLCRELQRIAGDKEFFLDCRTAGELLKVVHTRAWKWLGMLTADKILAAGEKGSKATHKASAFRYLADWP